MATINRSTNNIFRMYFDECADQDGEMLPPEMYVPNQQRWLELRARNRKGLNAITCICARH